ncbi:MAG TPA: PDZ domain-containing protein [Candidatus Acidoferrum sp.]|nr:PDZ domain-containing protein [Candidatus Acidoferrum sp.]
MTSPSFRSSRQNLSSRVRRGGLGICFSLSVRLALGFVFFIALAVPQSRATIEYEISLAKPSEHLFQVTMTVPEVHGELILQMPGWNALYQVRDFSSRIQQLTAESNGHSLQVEKLDKLTWRTRADGTVTVSYAIFWDSPGPFASQLNEEHAFINPAMVFLYVPNRRSENISLLFHELPKGWEIATPLDHTRTQSGTNIFHMISAARYDAFTDGPIEIGTFKFFQIAEGPNPIFVAVHGDNWKQPDIEGMLRKICNYQLQLMGGAPFDRYLFIFHIGKAAGGAGGGMEHANSTAINASSGQTLSGVAAHEFFHLWNVKRIRPASLEPVDYTREQYTRALWFAEGVTSTYGNYTLVRSGLWSKEQFYSDLAQQINELESRPANRWQSAEQSSLDAWLEKYPYYNGPDFSVSYYTKGQVLGVLLDILIRDRTNDEHSLDDVLRKMNDDFAKKTKPYRDSLDVRLTAESVAGASFEDFFSKYVAAAEPFPYPEILGKAGLLLRKQEVTRAELGFTIERDATGKAVVRSVASGSTAERAGLRPGDEIEMWNGESVPRRTDGWLRSRKPGDTLRLQIRRNDQSTEFSFALGGRTEEVFVIDEDPHGTDKAKAIREGLLHGTPVAASTAVN